MNESEPFAFQQSFLVEAKNPPMLSLEEVQEALRALFTADGTFRFLISEDTLAKLLNLPEDLQCAGPPDGSGCIRLEVEEEIKDIGIYCGECDHWLCDDCALTNPHMI